MITKVDRCSIFQNKVRYSKVLFYCKEEVFSDRNPLKGCTIGVQPIRLELAQRSAPSASDFLLCQLSFQYLTEVAQNSWLYLCETIDFILKLP